MTVDAQNLKIMKIFLSLVLIIDRDETNAGEVESVLLRGFGVSSGGIYEINGIYRQVTLICEHIYMASFRIRRHRKSAMLYPCKVIFFFISSRLQEC
jgi:hypothetical protein